MSAAPPQQRLAASVTRYLPAVVDPRPARAVHCPDLNACLVNEGRAQRVDCRAVHFGYAIPVTVVPLRDRPHLAELVLDPEPPLSPAAARYLLRHHPQLKPMAAAAGGRRARPEDDIAAIAQQISDHAEAIYQTWKARGLAPAEILKCHGGAAAAERFAPALKPRAPLDLTLDADNLERLVSTFVSEDKARLAARRRSPPPSIQLARQPSRIPQPTATWPLKNRLAGGKAARNSAECLDEVAREERRLIDALKTGVIIADERGRKTPARTRRKEPEAGRTVPRPELTSLQRQHLQGAGANPVRPFLTRGSVAERVLIFEKCPTELLDKRRSLGASAAAKPQTYSRDKENQGPGRLPPSTTLQRHVKANRNVHIPRFHFPQGKPCSEALLEASLERVSAVFQQFPSQQAPRDQFGLVAKACECPLYWKIPLFTAAGGEKLGYVEASTFLDFWRKVLGSCHDQASRFVRVLTRGQRDHLLPDDLMPLVQDVVDTHPGLTFLKEATEFHSRYVHTVIARIFYCVNRSWSGRVTVPEVRRSNLMRVVQLLEQEEDINQVTAYFSYEHFYVIYCKFWELDRDHDLFIDRADLQRHSDHALSTRIIDRIFSGAVTRGSRQHPDKMSYTEFVWFLLSEEDKQHPTAIEYWFRCMDLDGDGYLSMYELEYFYEEQLQRMEAIGIETLPFEDCLCQMLDMIRPVVPGKISLSDLKRCKMTPIFFDTFFNLEKYLDHEQRDPFASQRDHDTDGQELSDWDRFAAEEYELLVAEEGGADQQDDIGRPPRRPSRGALFWALLSRVPNVPPLLLISFLVCVLSALHLMAPAAPPR
ncbi:serine/threonine-protein phosphatase 2A regulatory subunit B'' subunit alpha-like isoform X2 [Bacillus rossius redtenbacheri]|uniref:serine/threonine-protein phosphatase 2A regulatory subunit B'' subunit alpha-like isoform X2 n=1 Tax=Bacillus rossius redtenbacheri TaxID=93214 RepID=UPI002FDCAC33